jgi:hypothetical protein
MREVPAMVVDLPADDADGGNHEEEEDARVCDPVPLNHVPDEVIKIWEVFVCVGGGGSLLGKLKRNF